jgi:hypothetical protein
MGDFLCLLEEVLAERRKRGEGGEKNAKPLEKPGRRA